MPGCTEAPLQTKKRRGLPADCSLSFRPQTPPVQLQSPPSLYRRRRPRRACRSTQSPPRGAARLPPGQPRHRQPGRPRAGAREGQARTKRRRRKHASHVAPRARCHEDCSRAAEQLKNNPRHKSYLEQVSLRQLEKLFIFLRGYLQGQSLAETMEQIQRERTIDPEEDLNKLDDKELAKRKSIMDELFEKNQKKKDDPNFVYDIEVEFPQDEQLQSCGWDTESADEF
ncbi:centrosomal protein of 19 kDa isoform 1-T1 [Dugong dugon]